MANYSKKAGEKVEEAMHERKEGTLKTGTGKNVTSKKQAIAIGLSEARKEGAQSTKEKRLIINLKTLKMITTKDLACLQIQLKVSKEDIQKAVAKVGTNRDEIEQYLQQQAKPHLVQLLHSNSLAYPNQYH